MTTNKIFSRPNRTINILTTCSGIGAPEMALRRLGLKSRILLACDYDKNCEKEYKLNYKPEHWVKNMYDVDAAPFKGQISLLVAGICCQTFSMAGNRTLTEEDGTGRGGLFLPMVKMINDGQPDVFIMENVKGMIMRKDGEPSAWESTIYPALLSTGYDIHYAILNAKDYGVPTDRPRLFVVGFREPRPDFEFPKPIPLKHCLQDYLDDEVPEEYVINDTVSYLTPRECLRIMGFPENFKISPEVSGDEIIHQCGNSIVVDVLMEIYKQIDITRYGK